MIDDCSFFDLGSRSGREKGREHVSFYLEIPFVC